MPWIRTSTGTVRADLDEGARAVSLPRMLADAHRFLQIELAVLQRMEHRVRGHQLGDARRVETLVGIALGERVTAVVIDEE